MSRNKKKSSNKRKLHKASKKVNRDRTSTTPSTGQTSTTPNTGQTSTTPNTGQTSTTPNTGQTSTPKKVDILIVLRYSVPLFKGKSSKWIVDKLQLLLILDKLLPPKKVDILIVLRYSVPLFKGVLTISKKFINTETNQYEKSAANRDELSDEVEIVEVARGQTSTTPATSQVYQKNYRDPFVLDISQVLMESRQKSKTSRDLEESHTDKEMAKHSQLRDEHAYLQGRMCEVYRELKEIKGELNELQQDYIKLHSHNKYINHENEVLRAEINNLKSQISSQDDADVESSESESNDNDNRPGKKRKVARRQIDQSDDDSETDEENARTEMKVILKTMPPELTLRYDEKFTNETNADILRQLIPRLIASMKPRFSPLYKQINDWLAALHKHRRARLLYVERGVIDKDNRRLHKNNRLSEKKSRRVKDAISLFKRNDDRVKDYDKTEVLNILKDTRYHSPEDLETDKEQPDGKRKIIVYNLSWRSDETVQLTRGRNYDDESYCITSRHPKNAPEWAYKTQNTPVNTDFSGPDTPAKNRESQSQTDNNIQTKHND
ncbi:hypothetical protein GLOIN_2v1785716 [Rhizophagus irregularis DAOM 181602=DAOM 197198]|nr:hypothetical protein GLOIN_2v1785716 [Rhizophagus irregularis DAOM 181602=DAOM 197198]